MAMKDMNEALLYITAFVYRFSACARFAGGCMVNVNTFHHRIVPSCELGYY